MESLPIATVGRILKKSGAPRTTMDAKVALSKVLTEEGEEIAKEALAISKHAGRRTVQASDIELAVELRG
ncbi:MAG: histone family protein [Methanosphaera sp.]|nr:histone family protein [Methanosphaera sp.]